MRRKSFNLLNALSLVTFVSLTILPLVSTMHRLDGDYDWEFHSLRPLHDFPLAVVALAIPCVTVGSTAASVAWLSLIDE
jgi:hypothetical protein